MPAQKFVGPNTKEALRLVRQQLGGEAVILSSRDVPEGVELLAIGAADLEALSRAPALPPAPESLPAAADPSAHPSSTTDPGAGAVGWAAPVPAAIAPVAAAPAFAAPSMPAPPVAPVAPPAVAAPPALPSVSPSISPSISPSVSQFASPLAAPQLDGLVSQFNQMRDLLQAHLSDKVWGDFKQSHDHALMLRSLLNAGFSPGLCSQLMQALPAQDQTLAAMRELMAQHLAQQIEVVEPLSVLDSGGVFAFIGPTGVGKTTAIAKIAARCVLRFGREQLVLMTTDNFRIGAQEQLKVYAKILGVSYVSVQDKDDFAHKLRQLSQRRIVLLDTAGVSQRDIQMLEQAQLLYEGAPELKRLLVMSSTTDLRTLEDVILMNTAAVRVASQQPALAGAIITKIDEAAQLGPVLDCLIRHRLPLMFLSNGQRVPEDLSQANIAYLVHRALHPRALGQSLQLSDEQVPALMADELSAWALRAAH
jgi:flagellar biosynthesis protein FlhF